MRRLKTLAILSSVTLATLASVPPQTSSLEKPPHVSARNTQASSEADALSDSVNNEIRKRGLNELNRGGWTAEAENLGISQLPKYSGEAVLYIPNMPYLSRMGHYNEILSLFPDLPIGIESVIYGSNNPSQSISELRKIGLQEVFGKTDPFQNHELFKYLAKSGRKFFGLEDKDLLTSALCLDDIRLNLVEYFALNNSPNQGRDAELKARMKKLAQCAKAESLSGSLGDYFAELHTIYFDVAIDSRAARAVEITKEALKKSRSRRVIILHGAVNQDIYKDRLLSAGIPLVIIYSGATKHYSTAVSTSTKRILSREIGD